MNSSTEELAARVKSAAEKKVGGKAVDGGKDKGGIDWFALIDEVLRSENAKSAADFGEVTPTADYIWGEAVDLTDVRPGDIPQFRNHIVKVRTQVLGKFKWENRSEEPPTDVRITPRSWWKFPVTAASS